MLEKFSSLEVILSVITLGIPMYFIIVINTANVLKDYWINQTDAIRLNEIIKPQKLQRNSAITFVLLLLSISLILSLASYLTLVLGFDYIINFGSTLTFWIIISLIYILIVFRVKRKKKLCIRYEGKYWIFINSTEKDMYLFRKDYSLTKDLLLLEQKQMLESIHGFIEKKEEQEIIKQNKINVDIFDDQRIDIDEQILLIFMIETLTFNIGIKEDWPELIKEIEYWEQKNKIVNFLSKRYEYSFDKLNSRGILQLKTSMYHLDSPNKDQYELKSNYLNSIRKNYYRNKEKIEEIKNSFKYNNTL